MTSTTAVTLPAIAFLGAGSMARAVLAGLLKPEVTVDGDIRLLQLLKRMRHW